MPICNKPVLPKSISNFTKPVYILQKDTVYFTRIDTSGRKIIEQSNREFEYQTLLYAKDAELEKLKQTLSQQNVDIKTLKQALIVKTTVRDTLNIKTFITQDSLTFAHKGKFLDIYANIHIKDSIALVNYQYRNELNFISYKHKKNLFSRPELRLKVISTDSNATINTTTFNIKESKPLVSLGVGVGYGLDLRSMKLSPNVSVGVFVPLITIKQK